MDELPREVRQRLGEPTRFEPVLRRGAGRIAGIAHTHNDSYFVTAVRVESPAAEDYRIEARVVGSRSPRLRWSAELAGWVVLCFDVAPGEQPTEPWNEPDLRLVLDVVNQMSAELRSSMPIRTLAGGAKQVVEVDLPTIADRMWGRCSTWRELDGRGVRDVLKVSDLSDWERSVLPRLAAVEAEWEELVQGDSLLHFDLRHDNLRFTHDGRVSVLDWGRACRGPAWVDPICLLLESSIGELDADELFLSTPSGAEADPLAADAFLVALASYWRHVATQPVDETTAWIRPRQARSAAATIAWLRKRWA